MRCCEHGNELSSTMKGDFFRLVERLLPFQILNGRKFWSRVHILKASVKERLAGCYLSWASAVFGGQRGSMWPRGCTSCWWMCTIKSRVMPFIPNKFDTCMFSSLVQIGTNQLRETTLTENIARPGSLGVGRGADNPGKTFVTKTEEATAVR
jgi:hypothetical protein